MGHLQSINSGGLMPGLCDWFTVTFDDQTIFLRASPPGEDPWSQQFTWDSIIRICFETQGVFGSDGIYVFTTQRPQSYVIPTEALGASELWAQFIDRKLFDAQLAIKMMTANSGLFCWPPKDQPVSLGVISYGTPPQINPTHHKIGMIIVSAALSAIGLFLTWNLFHCITLGGYFTIFQGAQFAISIALMIFLWRGSSTARWLIFVFYGLSNAWLMLNMLLLGSIQMSLYYFTLIGWPLTLLAALLVLPYVGTFQRCQRQSLH
jgi:hypothetical protein